MGGSTWKKSWHCGPRGDESVRKRTCEGDGCQVWPRSAAAWNKIMVNGEIRHDQAFCAGFVASIIARIPCFMTSGKRSHASITALNRGGGNVSVVLLLCSIMLVLCSSAVLWSSGWVWGPVLSSTSSPLLSRWSCPSCDTERPVQDGLRPIPVLSELVEAGGIEPPSRDISAVASTCVVRLLLFPGPRDSDGQDSLWARSRTYCFPSVPSGKRPKVACCCRPSRPRRQARADVAVI